MKVILKGGNKNQEMQDFFLEHILPILNFGIAIERSDRVINVYEKVGDKIEQSIDPTVEVIVELTEEERNIARDRSILKESFDQKIGKDFLDEALAIRKIEELAPSFSVEYYTCRYTPRRAAG